MSFGDISGWLNVVIGLVGLYFLIQTYRKEIWAPNPAATKSSAMPREPWLTPRRQFGLWLVLVLLAAISASFTFWQNRQANGPKLVGGIVYALFGEVNLEGKMIPGYFISR